MRARLGLLAVVGALALGVGFAAPAVAAIEPPGDWMSVTKVMVNRLGGVNVSGEVSCAGSYQRLVDGQLGYDDDGQWVPVPFVEGDLVVMSANNDNYTRPADETRAPERLALDITRSEASRRAARR